MITKRKRRVIVFTEEGKCKVDFVGEFKARHHSPGVFSRNRLQRILSAVGMVNPPDVWLWDSGATVRYRIDKFISASRNQLTLF